MHLRVATAASRQDKDEDKLKTPVSQEVPEYGCARPALLEPATAMYDTNATTLGSRGGKGSPAESWGLGTLSHQTTASKEKATPE